MTPATTNSNPISILAPATVAVTVTPTGGGSADIVATVTFNPSFELPTSAFVNVKDTSGVVKTVVLNGAGSTWTGSVSGLAAGRYAFHVTVVYFIINLQVSDSSVEDIT